MTSLMPRTSQKAIDTVQNAIDFSTRARTVLGELQSAMATLIESIPASGTIRRATDLQRVLGIHSKLAWQAHRIATPAHELENGRAVPGAMAMARFLAAATARGVPQSQADEVHRAFIRFEELVRVHAGNRSAFDSMIGGISSDGSAQLDLMHRRAAFRAYAHFVGARAKAMLSCSVLQPSQTQPDRFDLLALRGLIGLSTQRREASWEFVSLKITHEDGSLLKHGVTEALDPSGATDGISLFREFCSEPLPPLRFVPREEGRMSVLVDGDLIDNQSMVTLIAGFLMRESDPRYRTAKDSHMISASAVRTPSEVFIHDVLIRKDVFERASPTVNIYHTLGGGPFKNTRPEHDRLAMRESVVYVGRGSDALQTEEIPRYSEMVRAAMSRVGWDPSQFDVYRCRMEFPVVPSSVQIAFALPEAPG